MGRSRRRGGGIRPGILLAVVLVLAVLAYGPVFSSAGFTAMSSDRQTTMNVTADLDSVLALDKADAVTAGETSVLLNATNNFGQDMQTTVSLREASQDDADLVMESTNYGDSVTFQQPAGTTQTVKVKVENSSTLTDSTIYFDTKTTGSGVQARAANRSVPIN